MITPEQADTVKTAIRQFHKGDFACFLFHDTPNPAECRLQCITNMGHDNLQGAVQTIAATVSGVPLAIFELPKQQ